MSCGVIARCPDDALVGSVVAVASYDCNGNGCSDKNPSGTLWELRGALNDACLLSWLLCYVEVVPVALVVGASETCAVAV